MHLSSISAFLKITKSLNHFWIKYDSFSPYSSSTPCEFSGTYIILCRVQLDILHQVPFKNWYQGNFILFDNFVEWEDVINRNQCFVVNYICKNFNSAVLKRMGTVCSSLNEASGCVYSHIWKKKLLSSWLMLTNNFKHWSFWNHLRIDISAVNDCSIFSSTFRFWKTHDWRRPLAMRTVTQTSYSDKHVDMSSHEFPMLLRISSCSLHRLRLTTKRVTFAGPSLFMLILQIPLSSSTRAFNFSSCSCVKSFSDFEITLKRTYLKHCQVYLLESSC